MTREQAIDFLINRPYKFGHLLGFTKLKPIHNEWIRRMIKGKNDETLQASRGTYKTTCDSIALALICILLPNKRTLFMRKTDTDVKEVIKQVQKILLDPHTQVFVQAIYGVNLKLMVQSATEVSTNLTTDIKGTSQLVGIGLGSSLTGKHFDYIFTDDIVNINDRISKAERDRTKLIYQELQNVKNRGGRIFNTGTPWHQDDAFSIMPDADKYDCYTMCKHGVLTLDEINAIKERMTASLFSANYELRHIASEDVIFSEPETGAEQSMVFNGTAHLDSAFYGEDYTAFTVMAYKGGKFYVFGKIWRKHVQDCYGDILGLYQALLCDKLWNESNADKGMVAKELKQLGIRVATYNESMNKHIKIVTYLKAIWKDIIFVDGTDDEYIDQICDYTENAEHDDAPDSAACLARLLYRKANRPEYQSIFDSYKGIGGAI
jgi:predicted phage terminase large subunit-like protein